MACAVVHYTKPLEEITVHPDFIADGMVLYCLLQGIACGNPGVHALELTQARLHIDDASIIFVVVNPLRVGKKENGWVVVNMRVTSMSSLLVVQTADARLR